MRIGVRANLMRIVAVVLAASATSCSNVDDVDPDVSPVCQSAHGQPGHDHEAHMAGLPTCP